MKRIIRLCLMFFFFYIMLLPVPVNAEPVVTTYDDGFIYVGGIYDMWAEISEGADRATYQWQVNSGTIWGDLYESTDTYGYRGTKTNHLQIITKANDDSVAYGSGWENFDIRCKITLDGKVYYSDPGNLQAYESKILNGVLKNHNYTMNEPKVTNVYDVKPVEDGYTGWAYAGEQMHIQMDSKKVTDIKLIASELVYTPEIRIYDNGTVKYSDHEINYTPTKVNSEITVEFKLHMQLGINDMGYTEVKTMKIFTEMPEIIGIGTMKYETSMCKEQYNESQKLTLIPKGATVSIVEKSGANWYKVVYNDFVGYVGTSQMDVKLINYIDEVKASVPMPVVGEHPQFTAILETPGCKLYHIEPVTWEDITEGEFLTEEDVFREGHMYRLEIWVAAKDENQFKLDENDKPVVTGYVNESVVGIQKAYEQHPKEVLVLFWEYEPENMAPTRTPENTKSVTEIFKDVNDDWYTAYIQYVYDNGLMSGIQGTTLFQPNANILKAQVAQVLYNMDGKTEVTDKSVFTELKDVYEAEWYADAVAWAYNSGVVTGDLNTKKFSPNASVTREQLALMMYRYAQYKGYDTTATSELSGLKNADKVSNWALDAVKWAVGQGLISGVDKNGVKDLQPQGNASRAQMAAILQRFLENVK